MESNVCDISDIVELTETKQYINIPKVILDTLETAVRYKKISDGAMSLWIKLYAHVRTREVINAEWSIRKPMKQLAEEKGCTIKTIKTYLTQLEENHFIIIIKDGNRLLHEAHKILVRFPKDGIQLAKTLPDRRKSCSTRNMDSCKNTESFLSSTSSDFLFARSGKNYHSNISNKETNNKINNIPTKLSTGERESTTKNNQKIVNCLAVTQQVDIVSHDSFSSKYDELLAIQSSLEKRYNETKGLSDYQRLSSCREHIKHLKAKLDHDDTQKKATKPKGRLQWIKREQNVLPCLNTQKLIINKLEKLKKEHQYIFSTHEQAEIICHQLSQYSYLDENKQVITPEHHVNLLIACIKKNNKMLSYTKTKES